MSDLAQNDLLVLDSPDLWNQRPFQDMVVRALEREGFDHTVCEEVRAVFSITDCPTFESFCDAAEARASADGSDWVAANGLREVVAHMARHRKFNTSVYRPTSAQDHKKRYWPNNPKLLETNWEYYEDIRTADLFGMAHRFIEPSTPIVSAGSCFAANISRQLQYWGYNYLIEMGKQPSEVSGPEEYETNSASCGNIYNAVSMRQMVERAFGEWVPEKILLSEKPRILDPFRSRVDYKDRAGFHAKWAEYNAALRRALTKCEVFILTLGMTETWEFADTGLSTSTAPVYGDPTLFRVRNLTVEDNVRELERIYELFQRHNPNVKFITTVSPVPLNATFNVNEHVVVANGLSKSILRVALEEFSKRHRESVFYFPSYEIVTMGSDPAWEIDMRHVSNTAVARVMDQFQKMFLVSQEPLEVVNFTELQDFVPMKRNYALRWARNWVVHPLKRRLGIEGQPFSALFKR